MASTNWSLASRVHGGRGLEQAGGQLEGLLHAVDQHPGHAGAVLDHHDDVAAGGLGPAQTQPAAQVQHRHHRAAQVDDPEDIVRGLGHGRGRGPAADLAHRADVDTVFLTPDLERDQLQHACRCRWPRFQTASWSELLPLVGLERRCCRPSAAPGGAGLRAAGRAKAAIRAWAAWTGLAPRVWRRRSVADLEARHQPVQLAGLGLQRMAGGRRLPRPWRRSAGPSGPSG